MAAACTRPPPQAGPTPGPTPSVPGIVRIGIGNVTSLDPKDLDSPDALLVARQVYDGLVDYQPNTLAPTPALAERWEVTDGGRRFRFHLRSDAEYQDGTPVRARDFVYAWTRLADPALTSPYGFLLEDVTGFHEYRITLKANRISGLRAPSDRVFEVRLVRPRPDFVSVLGHPALSAVPSGARDLASRPVGAGPYRLTSPLVPEAPIRLAAFPGYWGPPPYVPNVEFRLFPDPGAAWPAFLRGDLEVAQMPGDVLAEAGGRFGLRGVTTLGQLLYCGFNLEDDRFGSRGLRRAVSLAVDRKEVAETIYGPLALPATAVVPPTIPGYEPGACGDGCRHDVEVAKSLADKVPAKDRRFALDYAEGPVGEQLADAVAEDLAAVGIRATPRAHDTREYASLIRRGRQEFFCLTWVADYPRQEALLQPLLHSGAVDNRSRVDDAKLDRLLERAAGTEDPEDRAARYREAEARALALMPIVPLAWFRSHLAARPFVQGFQVDPLGSFDVAALRTTFSPSA